MKVVQSNGNPVESPRVRHLRAWLARIPLSTYLAKPNRPWARLDRWHRKHPLPYDRCPNQYPSMGRAPR